MTMIIRKPHGILNSNNTYVKGYEPDREHAIYQTVMHPYHLERHGLLMEHIVFLVKGHDETLVAHAVLWRIAYTQNDKKVGWRWDNKPH